jgi:pSer/pThr/pTyr-binding forkhead associated (FHA) protein
MRRRVTQASSSPPQGAGAAAVRGQEAAEAPASSAAGQPIRTKPSPVSNTKVRPTSAGAAAIKAPATQSSAAAQRKTSTPEVQAPHPKKASGERAKGHLVIILEDGSDGSVLDLSPEVTTIGREGVDISFPHDDFLAKRHAEFVFSDGMLLLSPLESTNGVFLQVHQEVELDSGDVFRIGQQLLCFEMLGVVASALDVDTQGQAIPLGSPVPEGAWGRLGQVIAPNTMGSVYLLGGSEVYLGRERGDITFPGDGFVSGLHAQISMRNGRCFLKDLGSSNGTYLRLSKATPVRRGMLVLAGQQLFRVEG